MKVQFCSLCVALLTAVQFARADESDYPEWIPIEPQIAPADTSVESDTLPPTVSFDMFWRTFESGCYPKPGFLLFLR